MVRVYGFVILSLSIANLLLVKSIEVKLLDSPHPAVAIDTADAIARLKSLLFPMNRHVGAHRDLYGKYIPDSVHNCENIPKFNKTAQPAVCVKCSIDMPNCPILVGTTLEEVYLPSNTELQGTCVVIESLAQRMKNEVFGNGRPFRDSPECRQMVMQYLCLFWGSNNDMYTNCCIFQEDVTSADPLNHLIAPRPPCRSFCVQIALVCANDETFLHLCGDIDCPPTQDSCTPDPVVNGQVLAANLGCHMPYSNNPYVKNSAASFNQGGLRAGLGLLVTAVTLALQHYY